MVKTSAQPYKHIIHIYVYNHIQRTAWYGINMVVIWCVTDCEGIFWRALPVYSRSMRQFTMSERCHLCANFGVFLLCMSIWNGRRSLWIRHGGWLPVYSMPTRGHLSGPRWWPRVPLPAAMERPELWDVRRRVRRRNWTSSDHSTNRGSPRRRRLRQEPVQWQG